MKNSLNIKDFIPFFIVSTVTVISFIIRVTLIKEIEFMRIMQCFGCLLIPLVIPIFNHLFNLKIKPFINYVISFHSIITVLFGAVLDLYHIFPLYDKVVHCIFGITGGLVVISLLLSSKIEIKNQFASFLIVLLIVLGLAACWEIYEYTFTALFNHDLQGWIPNLDEVGDLTVREFFKNYRPLWDTMWDIIVAAIGTIILYVSLFIDKVLGSKLITYIKTQSTNE